MATDGVPFTAAGQLLLPATERLFVREKGVEIKITDTRGCVRRALKDEQGGEECIWADARDDGGSNDGGAGANGRRVVEQTAARDAGRGGGEEERTRGTSERREWE